VSVGARFINANSGYVQIDERFANLSLRTKGTLTTGGVPGGSTPNYPYFRAVGFTYANPTTPLIAIYSENGYVIPDTVTYRDGVVDFYFVSLEPSITFEYFVFDVPLQTALPSVGLIIRHPTTGVVTFRSDLKYMRVVNQQAYTYSNTTYSNMAPVPVPAGKKYAVIFSSPGALIDQRFTGAANLYIQNVITQGVRTKVPSGGVDYVMTAGGIYNRYGPGAVMVNPPLSADALLTVIDVTGY